MRRATAAALGIIGTAAIAAAAPAPTVRIEAGIARGGQGARIPLSVVLRANSDVVATENLLLLPPPLRVHFDRGTRPACTGGPDGPAVAFAFYPDGCAPWRDCTGIRARVMDLGPVVPIPDGAALYMCTVDFGDTPPGEYPIAIESPSAVDPNGVTLPVDGRAGTVIVEEGFATRIEAATVSGLPGTRHRLDATLRTDVEVAGTDNHVAFHPQTTIAPRANGRPACERGPDLNHRGAAFSFTPSGCEPGVSCDGVRALILGLDSVLGIPDGTVLYACQLDIASDAGPGVYPLTVSNVGASDPDGVPLLVGATDGAVIIEAPTPTPTETSMPTPSATATTPPTSTPTRHHGSSGCTTVDPDGTAGWLLLPLAWLAARAPRAWRPGGSGHATRRRRLGTSRVRTSVASATFSSRMRCMLSRTSRRVMVRP